MSEEKIQELRLIIDKSVDGTSSEEELKKLDKLIVNEPKLRRYYCEYIYMNIGIERIFARDIPQDHLQKSDFQYDKELWSKLAQYEREAEFLEIIKEPEARQVIVEKLKIEKAPRQVDRFWFYTALITTAALILILAYVFNNPRQVNPLVATLVDTVNARWADPSLPSEVGSDLRTGSRKLLKGFAEVKFDDGAVVIIEGPSEFVLESSKSIFLQSGKLVAHVSEYATGFIVNTPGSSIIDLGTEFGVTVQADGSSTVQMFTGQASLIVGKAGDKKRTHILKAGLAKYVDINSGEVLDAEFRRGKYVRDLDSETTFARKGKEIDLADVVGGGDGFGTAKDNFGLNPLTGEHSAVWPEMPAPENERSFPGLFRQAQSEWIDAVFIPDGGEGPVQIAQNGLSFDGFSDTSGKMWVYLRNRKKSFELSADDNPNMAGKPCLIMHANLGITFDLDKFRERFGGQVDLKAFRSQSGFKMPGFDNKKVDFWVLVDGRVRYQKLGAVATVELEDVEISLGPDDRYLTLATTESDDGTGDDWAMFVSPTLILE
jgi:hypothetical protein